MQTTQQDLSEASLFDLQQAEWDIIDKLDALDAALEEQQGVYSAEQEEEEQDLRDRLRAVMEAKDDKYNAYGHVIGRLEEEREHLSAEADRWKRKEQLMKERRQHFEALAVRKQKRIDWMKQTIQFDMEIDGLQEAQLGPYSAALGPEAGKQKVIVDDAEALPAQYRVREYRFKATDAEYEDRRDLLDQLASGIGAKVSVRGDKRALYKPLQDGDIEGAHLQPKKTILKLS